MMNKGEAVSVVSGTVTEDYKSHDVVVGKPTRAMLEGMAGMGMGGVSVRLVELEAGACLAGKACGLWAQCDEDSEAGLPDGAARSRFFCRRTASGECDTPDAAELAAESLVGMVVECQAASDEIRRQLSPDSTPVA